jgi:hypothetical protein
LPGTNALAYWDFSSATRKKILKHRPKVVRRGHDSDPLPLKNASSLRKISSFSAKHYPVNPFENVISVVGAGDCFTGAFVAGLLNGLDQDQAVSVGIQVSILLNFSLFVADVEVKQWVETNPSNICFLPTDIHFYIASWYYASSLQMSVHRCSWILDGLVSSHPRSSKLERLSPASILSLA